MPHQSAMADKEEKLLNKSRLSLEDLLGQLRHHGASVRSGALDGLGDYFRRHPSQLVSGQPVLWPGRRALTCAMSAYQAWSDAGALRSM